MRPAAVLVRPALMHTAPTLNTLRSSSASKSTASLKSCTLGRTMTCIHHTQGRHAVALAGQACSGPCRVSVQWCAVAVSHMALLHLHALVPGGAEGCRRPLLRRAHAHVAKAFTSTPGVKRARRCVFSSAQRAVGSPVHPAPMGDRAGGCLTWRLPAYDADHCVQAWPVPPKARGHGSAADPPNRKSTRRTPVLCSVAAHEMCVNSGQAACLLPCPP